jgi:hypothetical protein
MYSSNLGDLVANKGLFTDGFFATKTQRIEGKKTNMGGFGSISRQLQHHCRNFLNLAYCSR